MGRTSYKSPEFGAGGTSPEPVSDLDVGLAVGSVTAGWLRFETTGVKPGRKTVIWRVSTKDHGEPLGQIDWYAAWRRYVFEPEAGTVYEEDCLRTIAAFVENLTRKRRAAWKQTSPWNP